MRQAEREVGTDQRRLAVAAARKAQRGRIGSQRPAQRVPQQAARQHGASAEQWQHQTPGAVALVLRKRCDQSVGGVVVARQVPMDYIDRNALDRPVACLLPMSDTAAPIVRRVTVAGAGQTVELAVREWPGPHDVPPLLCIPGFTRTGRDFEELGRALAGRRRLLCPDLAGRGESDRLADSETYTMRTYLAQMIGLLEALDVQRFAILGVSMGGLLAMALAAERGIAVDRLVVVDVGPSVPRTAVDLLDLYLATERSFADFDSLLLHVRKYFAACNLPSELAWRWFALRGARKLPDGRYVPDYDPAIRVPFRHDFRGMAEGWAIYDRIAAPTLVLRGATSHVLPAEVADEMTRRGPRARLTVIPGTGHWPALVRPEEIALVERFLAA